MVATSQWPGYFNILLNPSVSLYEMFWSFGYDNMLIVPVDHGVNLFSVLDKLTAAISNG